MKWKFTPDQFIHVWEAAGLDRIPYPLSVRPSDRTDNERAARLKELAGWHRVFATPEVDVALRVLASPELRVEVFGLVGQDDSRPIRVLGAGVGDAVAVVSQVPGVTPDVGGNITLTLGPPETLPARIVSALPTVDAGREPTRSASLAEVEQDSKNIVMSSPTVKSVAGQVRKALNAPRNGIGQMLATTRLDAKVAHPPEVLSWIDVARDGRYLVRTGADVDVVPATKDVLVAELLRLLQS
ncbi:ESX secretion-associated protein EspG [Antrihabitans cavernicola]|uniref:ESX secretion-associated protein EspG n=1 Tax=Antrihabitans cavernicola TaxID=2495913 RepID=UPI001658E74B|nr:ESX secretion-associated protein EspG [Spelaeibacter cavernicola]